MSKLFMKTFNYNLIICKNLDLWVDYQQKVGFIDKLFEKT